MPVTTQYNEFTLFPEVSYKCIKHMMSNNELIWRLLQYNDANAYREDTTHANLTTEQKGALIYDGIRKETDCRVFMDTGADYSWTDQVAILRITPIELIPTNYIYGNMAIAFEVYSHYKINQLSNYQTRLNMITQQIISVFNGTEVGGLGRLYFDSYSSSRSKMQVIGQIPYKGNAVIMCNWTV